MRNICRAIASFSSAAALIAPACAIAQSENETAVPQVKMQAAPPSVDQVKPRIRSARSGISANPANWLPVSTDAGRNFVHIKSGAICPDIFRDLKLVRIDDHAPDGTNSSCQYQKVDESGFSRLTFYVYTAEGLTGPTAYSMAKNDITEVSKMTALTVTERKAEGQQCHRGVIKPLAEAILARMKKEGSEGQDANLGLGLAMYDYSIPARGDTPAKEQTSMLSVFQTGKWIVKTRVTLPKSEKSYEAACNYGGITSVAQARVITRQDGPAV